MHRISTETKRTVEWKHGVTFTVRRFTLRRRERAVADVAGAAEAWRKLTEELAVIRENPEPDAERISVIEAELARINREEITPAYFRHGLLGVDGLEIDGEAATVDTINRLVREIDADDWPDIFHDILAAILAEFRVEEREAGESGPPTTSPS